MRARTAFSSIPSLPHQTTSHHDCSCSTEEAALHKEISEHARYVHFSAVLPRSATLSKLVACCGREMHSLVEPYSHIYVKGSDRQKASKTYFLMQIHYSYIVWNNVLKFQENRKNIFWTMHLSVGMGMAMAGMWYLSKHFLSSDNISLSIHKNPKITSTVPLLKLNYT